MQSFLASAGAERHLFLTAGSSVLIPALSGCCSQRVAGPCISAPDTSPFSHDGHTGLCLLLVRLHSKLPVFIPDPLPAEICMWSPLGCSMLLMKHVPP